MPRLLDAIEIETEQNPSASVIWMHGLGADGGDFVPIVDELGLEAAPALRFVFPHAPMRPVTINGGAVMRAWYDVSFGELEGTSRRTDERGVRESQTQINALIDRWQDDATLRVDTDTGTQTRTLSFRASPAGEPTWQGQSLAQWNVPGQEPEGRHDQPQAGLRAPQRRAVQQPGDGHRVLGAAHPAEQGRVADGDDQGRGSGLLHAALPHQFDFKKLPTSAGWNPTPARRNSRKNRPRSRAGASIRGARFNNRDPGLDANLDAFWCD